MESITIKFTANGQTLTGGGLYCASNTVRYIIAEFDLGDNWQGYDSVRAVWSNDFKCISTVLDPGGSCTVPHEVLERRGKVTVNLVGSILEDDELTDRLTTYPVLAITVDANAKICGTETAEVTPSQFEQFVEVVRDEADRAEQAMDGAQGFANDSKEWAETSEEWAHKAEQSAAQAGYMFFYIEDDDTSPDYGCLFMDRTDNVEVQFSLEDGYLFVEG
jgi:hypothetical protein